MATQLTVALTITIAVMFLFSGASSRAPASPPESFATGPSSGAQAPTPDCMANLGNMYDCLSYVTAGSNLTKPDKACCPELAGLVDSSPQCLCYLLDKNITASYGISIDMPKALKLPAVCGVSTPPVSLCSAIIGVPVGSPATSPGMAPGGVAASRPSTGNDAGGATSIPVSSLTYILALSISFLPISFF